MSTKNISYKFNSKDGLPLNKILKILNMTYSY